MLVWLSQVDTVTIAKNVYIKGDAAKVLKAKQDAAAVYNAIERLTYVDEPTTRAVAQGADYRVRAYHPALTFYRCVPYAHRKSPATLTCSMLPAWLLLTCLKLCCCGPT